MMTPHKVVILAIEQAEDNLVISSQGRQQGFGPLDCPLQR